MGSFTQSPIVGIPSGRDTGQMHARIVEVVRARPAAASNMGAGRDVQNHRSPARAEKRVRKSDTATFRKMEVVICPYDIPPRPVGDTRGDKRGQEEV